MEEVVKVPKKKIICDNLRRYKKLKGLVTIFMAHRAIPEGFEF